MKGKNGYIAVDLHKDDALQLDLFLSSLGLENYINPNELHATLLYDRNGTGFLKSIDANKVYVANVVGKIEIMGNDPWRAIVVHLESKELKERHEEIKKELNATHSYPDFKLHISLKYSPSDSDLEMLLANEFPFKEFLFTNEHQEDIIE